MGNPGDQETFCSAAYQSLLVEMEEEWKSGFVCLLSRVYSVALTGPEVSVVDQDVLYLRPSCLCLWRAGIKGMHHNTRLVEVSYRGLYEIFQMGIAV